MTDIGKRIRELREQQGMTQEELAHKIGYKSRVSINKIELSRDLPIYKIAKVAEALGVTPQYIMGWEDTETPYDNVNVNSIWNAKGRIVDLHLFGRYVHESTINALNEENQKKVQAYAEKLLELQKMEEDN